MEKLPDGLGLAKNVPDFDYLLRLPAEHKNKLPAVPAIYFFHTTSGLIVYIGSAINLRQRVAVHGYRLRKLIERGVAPLFIAWLPVEPILLRGLEEKLIQSVKPPLNGIHKGLKEGRTHSYDTVVALHWSYEKDYFIRPKKQANAA